MNTIKHSDLDGSLPPHEGLRAAKSIVKLFKSYVEEGTIQLNGIAIRFGENDITFEPDEYLEWIDECLEYSAGTMKEIYAEAVKDAMEEDDDESEPPPQARF